MTGEISNCSLNTFNTCLLKEKLLFNNEHTFHLLRLQALFLSVSAPAWHCCALMRLSVWWMNHYAASDHSDWSIHNQEGQWRGSWMVGWSGQSDGNIVDEIRKIIGIDFLFKQKRKGKTRQIKMKTKPIFFCLNK